MNQAIITLIPKKTDINDPSLNDLKNWRPISFCVLTIKF